jgi:sterol 14-demethylase
MKFAKLEQNIITAFFCAMFDFHLADKNGHKRDETVKLNTNNYNASKPDETMYLKYTIRKDVLQPRA